MKKAFAASLIAIVCLGVITVHAWITWGEVDGLRGGSRVDRAFFEYSLFLESFIFMVSAAYFAGPKIYRICGEAEAAVQFEGEKQSIVRLVQTYSALCVVLRRLFIDSKNGVPVSETIIVISLICIPPTYLFIKTKYGSVKNGT